MTDSIGCKEVIWHRGGNSIGSQLTSLQKFSQAFFLYLIDNSENSTD